MLTLLPAVLCATPLLQHGAWPEVGAASDSPVRVLVRLREPVPEGEVPALHPDATLVRRYSFAPLYLVSLPQSRAASVVAMLRKDPRVRYAVFDQQARIQSTPNDPRFIEQWSLENSADTDINAESAWELSTGSPTVAVGVIDTGVDYNHADLAANMWVNALEVPDNGIDDDGNGYIDDVHGIDATTGTGDPNDDHGHGTHIAGTIAAVGNNGIGIAGIAWQARVIACKFTDATGVGSLSDAIACLDYLRALKLRQAAPVNLVAVNSSWSEAPYFAPLEEAIAALGSAGVLFVSAAGNSKNDLDSYFLGYPAAFALPNLIAVAASDKNDALWGSSSFGRHSVHLAAPGELITGLLPGDRYTVLSGSSMAAAHVTGIVALTAAAQPSRDAVALRNLVLAGGEPLLSLQQNTLTGRRLRGADNDGVGALSCAGQQVTARLEPRKERVLAVPGRSTLGLSVLSIDCAEPGVEPVVLAGAQALTLSDADPAFFGIDHDGIFSTTWQVPMPTPQVQPPTNIVLHFPPADSVEVRFVWPYSALHVDYAPRQIVGNELPLGDEGTFELPAPFAISFAGEQPPPEALIITSNGLLSFTDATSWALAEPLPTRSYETVVAPLWDDLNPEAGGGVFYEVLGEAPTRELVVEWRDVPRYGGAPDATVRVQVVFFENRSDVLFNYADATYAQSGDAAATATVGIQVAGDVATTWSYARATVTDGTSLLWHVNRPALPFAPAEAPPAKQRPPHLEHSASLTADSRARPVEDGCDCSTSSARESLLLLFAVAGPLGLLRRRRSGGG